MSYQYWIMAARICLLLMQPHFSLLHLFSVLPLSPPPSPRWLLFLLPPSSRYLFPPVLCATGYGFSQPSCGWNKSSGHWFMVPFRPVSQTLGSVMVHESSAFGATHFITQAQSSVMRRTAWREPELRLILCVSAYASHILDQKTVPTCHSHQTVHTSEVGKMPYIMG